MIDFGDLKFDAQASIETVEAELKDKLNISTNELKAALGSYVSKNCDKISTEFVNIAPYADYGKLLEDADEMAAFLSSECSKADNWNLASIIVSQDHKNLLQFKFYCSAVDEGDGLVGFVLLNKEGKIYHIFAQATDR